MIVSTLLQSKFPSPFIALESPHSDRLLLQRPQLELYNPILRPLQPFPRWRRHHQLQAQEPLVVDPDGDLDGGLEGAVGEGKVAEVIAGEGGGGVSLQGMGVSGWREWVGLTCIAVVRSR